MGCPSKQAAGCTIFSLIFFGIATAVSSTLVLHFYRVGTALLTKAGDFSVLDAAYSLLPIVLFYPCMVIYMLHSQVAMPQYPVLMEILFSTAFAEMAIHVMAGSICHRPLEPLKRYVRSLLLPPELRANFVTLACILRGVVDRLLADIRAAAGLPCDGVPASAAVSNLQLSHPLHLCACGEPPIQ